MTAPLDPAATAPPAVPPPDPDTPSTGPGLPDTPSTGPGLPDTPSTGPGLPDTPTPGTHGGPSADPDEAGSAADPDGAGSVVGLDGVDLDGMAARVDPLDDAAMAATREVLAGLARVPGALGRLDELTVWLAGAQGAAPPREPERARLVVFAADHGIAAAGVSAYPPGATARMVDLLRSGRSVTDALARSAGVTVRLVDLAVDADAGGAAHGVRRSSGRIDREDALSRAEAEAAFAAGAAVADEEVDGGADLLIAGDLGVAGTTVAAVLVATLTDAEPVKVVGRGSGIDDRTWMRKVVAIRDGLRRARPVTHDPMALLAVSGGADVAAMTGFLVQAAVRRTPVLLDGVLSAAAALVGSAITAAAPAWWVAAHRSAEPAHRLALEHLDLPPVLDLGIRAGGGAGALTVLPLLRAAVRAAADTATAAEAGLTRGTGPADDPQRATGRERATEPDPTTGPAAEPTPATQPATATELAPATEPATRPGPATGRATGSGAAAETGGATVEADRGGPGTR